jgi:pimeloyl-ACP methyl ester carboxylesterase
MDRAVRYKIVRIPTRVGEIVAGLAQPWRGGDAPLVIMLPGALRTSLNLGEWGDRLAGMADVALFDLPGHGKSAAPEKATVAEMAEIMAEAIGAAFPGRRALLVGESLGGTIGLALGGLDDPGPVCAVFAADPPMTTTKLWAVHLNFRMTSGKADGESFFHRLGRDTFGITPDGLVEIVYYPLLGALKVPVLIATGDVALQPPRSMTRAPSLFDGVDQFVAAELFPGKVEVERIADCGHLLLVDAPDACIAIIRRLLAEHVAEPAPA